MFQIKPIRPLIKWAGGKRKLLPILRRLIPSDFTRYVEPFVGGGALFWDLAMSNSFISDSNPELIHFYLIVRDHPDELIDEVKNTPITKKDYYDIRSQQPDELEAVQRAARFIYLNKTCYNGLYRVNQKGLFNTPFCGRTEVNIIDEDNLYPASELLKHVELACADYTEILPKLEKRDFVYLDPPYVPVGRYSDFNRYTRDFFTEDDQVLLAEEFRNLSNRGIKALLSNSNNKLIRKLYDGFWIFRVKGNRQISCRSDGRGEINELLIANYNPE